MENYSFLADMLSTFRSSSDLVKIVWLFCPILFVHAAALSLRAAVGMGGKALAFFPNASGPRQRTLPPVSEDVLPGWMADADHIVIIAHKHEGHTVLRQYTPGTTGNRLKH